jgi:predicted lipoprotein with Yx(FWY)xxD motif
MVSTANLDNRRKTMHHQKTLLSWMTMAAMAALVIAACAPATTLAPTDTVSPLPSDTPPAPAATAVIPNTGATAAPTATIVVLTNSSLGQILTDAKGMTLYAYLNDSPDVSNCSGQCAANWPPLTIPQGTTPTAGDGITATLGTVTRADGSLQVSVNHMPVYYFASDTTPGDASGQGKGGVWYVFDASGNLVKTPVSTATPGSSASMVGIVTDTPVAAPTTYYP